MLVKQQRISVSFAMVGMEGLMKRHTKMKTPNNKLKLIIRTAYLNGGG
jgi:hypothetical protein